MTRTAQLLLQRASLHLKDDFLSKIQRGVAELSDDQFWWRPNENSNSIGNLLLHLEGNVRQWIISGLGGVDDTRTRSAEFDERQPRPRELMLEQLSGTVDEAVAVLGGLTETALGRHYSIQGFSVSGVEIVVHVVEHFSCHTGQILYVVKMLRDVDLALYDL